MARPWLRFHTPLIEPDMQISRIRLVWGLFCQGLRASFFSLPLFLRPQFFCSTRAASILPPRPQNLTDVARRHPARSAVALTSPAPPTSPGRTLTVASTAPAIGPKPADDQSEGSPPWHCTVTARTKLVFGWIHWDPDHEAVVRFCGRAPRRRVHSPSGIAAITGFGLPPPRIDVDSHHPKRRDRRRNLMLQLLFGSPSVKRTTAVPRPRALHRS